MPLPKAMSPTARGLPWVWVFILGAELNAELERGRQIQAGAPPDEEPFLEHRDTAKLGHGP